MARRRSGRARSRSGTAARSRACCRRRSNSACGRWRCDRAASASVASSNASATWPIAREMRQLLAVGGGDAGALLAAMLQRVEAEVGEVGRLRVAEDAEDTALVLEFVEHGLLAGSALFYAARSPRSTVSSARDHSLLSFAQPAVDSRRCPSIAIDSRSPPVRPIDPGRARRASAASCSSALQVRRPSTDTTTRDADSPKSVRRRVAVGRRAGRSTLQPMPPVPNAHSASVTARPPSEQSCADCEQARPSPPASAAR